MTVKNGVSLHPAIVRALEANLAHLRTKMGDARLSEKAQRLCEHLFVTGWLGPVVQVYGLSEDEIGLHVGVTRDGVQTGIARVRYDKFPDLFAEVEHSSETEAILAYYDILMGPTDAPKPGD